MSNSYAESGFLAEVAAAPRAAPLATTQTLATVTLKPFPNPATSQLHLPGLPTGTRVHLLDALGRVARETTLLEAGSVSVSGLAPGLYTLRATDKQGQPYAARVAVE